jgi:dynein heavy chain
MAPFPANNRANILAKWKQHLKETSISYTEPFMLSSAFSDPTSIRKWHLHGTPFSFYFPLQILSSSSKGLLHDTNSVENAIMATESQQWPLFIDPQGLATKWVLSIEKSKSIVSSSTTSPDFVRVLSNALRYAESRLPIRGKEANS